MTADKLSPDSIAECPAAIIAGGGSAGGVAGEASDVAGAVCCGAAEPEMVIADLLDLVHRASLKAAGGSLEALLEVEKAPVSELAELGIARLGRAWQMLLKGHGEVTSAPQPGAAAVPM